MFFKKIGNLDEYHRFFSSPYDNSVEEVIFNDLKAFIENHFGTRVKKLALINTSGCKRIEMFLYSYEEYLLLDDGGLYTGEISINNGKIILNAAKEIISHYKAEEYFSQLSVVRFYCFETTEIGYIRKTIYLSQFKNLQRFLIDGNIVRIYAPIPYSLLILFLRNNDYAVEFKKSEKCNQFHEMLYQYAKPLDVFNLIKNVGDIKEGWWYYYDNEANYTPQKNTFTSYDNTLFINK